MSRANQAQTALKVLRWWWARPKSFGMTAIVLLVAGALWLAESKGLIGGNGGGGNAPVVASDNDRGGQRESGPQSVELLVASTQSPTAPPTESGSGGTDPRRDTKTDSKSESKKESPRPKVVMPNMPRPGSAAKTDPRPSQKPDAKKDAPAEKEPLGKLTKVSGQTYRTTAGLIYTPGSADGHRLKHVAKHFSDDLSKPVHGVFSGDERENFAAIDEAYLLATTDPKRTKTSKERGRTIHKVDMRRKIGFVGGQVGRRKNKPTCTGIQLVLEGERVITAYPIEMRRR